METRRSSSWFCAVGCPAGHEAYQAQLLQEDAAEQAVVPLGRGRGGRRGSGGFGQQAVEGLDALLGLNQAVAAAAEKPDAPSPGEQQQQQRAQQPELHPLAVHQEAQVGLGQFVAGAVFLADGAAMGIEGVAHRVVVAHQVEVVEGARTGVVQHALQVANLVLGGNKFVTAATEIFPAFVQIVLGRVQLS